jgi:hypothetical protein
MFSLGTFATNGGFSKSEYGSLTKDYETMNIYELSTPERNLCLNMLEYNNWWYTYPSATYKFVSWYEIPN